MDAENLDYEIVENSYKLNNTQGIIKCDEELIDFQKQKNSSINILMKIINLIHPN